MKNSLTLLLILLFCACSSQETKQHQNDNVAILDSYKEYKSQIKSNFEDSIAKTLQNTTESTQECGQLSSSDSIAIVLDLGKSVDCSNNKKQETTTLLKYYNNFNDLFFKSIYHFQNGEYIVLNYRSGNAVLDIIWRWLYSNKRLNLKQQAFIISQVVNSNWEAENLALGINLEKKYRYSYELKTLIDISKLLGDSLHKKFIHNLTSLLFFGWFENEYEFIKTNYGIIELDGTESILKLWPKFSDTYPWLIEVYENEGFVPEDI